MKAVVHLKRVRHLESGCIAFIQRIELHAGLYRIERSRNEIHQNVDQFHQSSPTVFFRISEADQETGEKISYTNEAFYKQIAIGGGFGIRLDFSYFILRLDMAVKLRHAAPFPDIPDDGQNWRNYWFRDFRPDGNRVPLRFSDIVAFNLGFGYPF